MTQQIEHHTQAIVTICNACLELLETQPDTDVITELKQLLESQFDILDCILQDRHFGSDQLDSVINDCARICAQIKQIEEK